MASLNSQYDNFSENFYFLDSFKLRDDLDLCLVDIGSGSDTKVMVPKLLTWAERTSRLEGTRFGHFCFQRLNEINEKLLALLQKSDSNSPEDYEKIRTLSLQSREQLQTLSKLSQVEIEPQKSRTVLDQVMEADDIVMAGVPGAGGDDAIFVIGKKTIEEGGKSLHERV